MLVNIQRDTWRKERVRKHASLGEGAHDVNVDDALDAKRRVWRALALLPTRRRAILVMELKGLVHQTGGMNYALAREATVEYSTGGQ